MDELNDQLRSVNSPLAKRQFLPAIDFASQYEIQSSRVNSSKANLGELIKRAVGGTALGTFNTSQALNLTSTTFGKPVVAIYQGAGTSSANQIYPIRGANVTLGRYEVFGGITDYASYNGTSDNWRAMLIDTNGTSTQSITFAADWIYLDYQTGVVA